MSLSGWGSCRGNPLWLPLKLSIVTSVSQSISKNRMNRHIILTSGRSGSNYLTNTLNQHPHLANYGEVLASMLIPYKFYQRCKQYKICHGSIIDYLNYVYSSKAFFYTAQFYSAYSHIKKKKPIRFKTWGKISTLGTKDFFLNYRQKNAVDFLISNKDIAMIYLYRENNLRRYLSTVFLRKTQISATEKKIEVSKVHIEPEHMMTHLEAIDKEVEDEKRIVSQLNTHRLLTIRYEDYFASSESVLSYNQQVFEFLGVEPIQLKSQQQKILPQAMRDMVDNYEEFRACLINTQYHKYLD